MMLIPPATLFAAFDWTWLLIAFVLLQPMLRQRMIAYARQRKLSDFEQRRGSRAILLVHRQETMSLFGFPLLKYIDINDSEEVLRAIHMTDPSVPIDLIIHSPGGLVLAATQIARAIHRWPGKVTVFVPHYAMSGGTLIALAADKIVMTEHAVLGPVDPQIQNYPAASILEAVRRKAINDVDDTTLILADVAQKAISQVRALVVEVLTERHGEERARELASILAEGTWTHDYPIHCDDARRIGLDVDCQMPEEVMQLMALFPQPTRQPNVEYTPERRVPRARDRSARD